MKTKKRSSNQTLLIFLILLFLAVFLVLFLKNARSGPERQPVSAEEISNGVSYLKDLESQDPSRVQNEIQERARQQEIEQFEQTRQQLVKNEVDVWSLLGQSVIMGDSRAVGFSFYNWMPEDQVLAESGADIRSITEKVDLLAQLGPSDIYLCYGINDLFIDWPSAEAFAENLHKAIEEVHKVLPNSIIYVNSILPVKLPTEEELEVLNRLAEENETEPIDYDFLVDCDEQIRDYNQALKAMCSKYEYPFIDNDQISRENEELWANDCIHLDTSFYPIWAKNMKLAAYDYIEKTLKK